MSKLNVIITYIAIIYIHAYTVINITILHIVLSFQGFKKKSDVLREVTNEIHAAQQQQVYNIL